MLPPIFFECPICEENYQHGPDLYEGRKCDAYGFWVCSRCFESNWDGWHLDAEKKILTYCKDKNIIPPMRNKKGWLPRGD
jgi:hypothetical protein